MYAIIRAYDTDEWNSWATLAIAKFDAEYIAKLKARKEAISTISAMGNPPDRVSWYDHTITFFDHSIGKFEEEHPEVFEALESIFF